MKRSLIIVAIALLPVLGQAEVIWNAGQTAHCGGDWKYGGCTAASLNIDVGVWPVAWGHTVGMVYTTDGWNSYDVEYGDWSANVGNPYGGQDEQWLIDLPIGYTSFGNQLSTVEYALFVTIADGSTVWDNNNGWNFYFAGGGSDAITSW